MREPDLYTGAYGSPDGQFQGWIAPLDRVDRWVAGHPERVAEYSRGERFLKVWREIMYCRYWVEGHFLSDEPGKVIWIALVLQNLKEGIEIPRMYDEAEWGVLGELVAGEVGSAHVDGDALYDQDTSVEPVFMYQWHGLPDDLQWVAPGRSIMVDAAAESLRMGNRPLEEECDLMSKFVNRLRVSNDLPPLLVENGLLTTDIDLGVTA